MGQSHAKNYKCIFKQEKFYLEGFEEKNVLYLKLVMKNSFGIEVYHAKVRLSSLKKMNFDDMHVDKIWQYLGDDKSFEINPIDKKLKIKEQRSQKFKQFAGFKKQIQLPTFIQNLFFQKQYVNQQNFVKQKVIAVSCDQIQESQESESNKRQLNSLKEAEEDNSSVYNSKQLVDKSCFYYQKLKLEYNRITALSDYCYIFLDAKIEEDFLFSFKFTKITKNVAIGIADQKYISKYYLSSRQNHIACFYNDGRKFTKGNYLKQTHAGFQEGDSIQVRGYLSQGIVQWIVNKNVAWTLSFNLFLDKTIVWKPFALLINQSDCVRVTGILPDSNILWIYFTIWFIQDCDYDLLYEVYHLTSGKMD